MRAKDPEISREKETLILDAAQKRFALYGINKVTMDEIAEDIGMGKASLYYYFKTKEDVFRGVISREQQEFFRIMNDVAQQKLFIGNKLRAYVSQRIKLSSQFLNLTAFNYKSWLDAKPICKDLFDSFVHKERQLLIHILQEAKESGEIVIASPEKVAHLVLHLLEGLRLRLFGGTSMPPMQLPSYDEFEKEAQLLVETLLYGIVTRIEI
ncbi:MAG TPA: TetR/AcrR family transcriptional regulator [Candidatus Kapabacteria bacterium]|nr:TetR/AcrR family transcriptional regulator [Candidatus Kapabacteria bacterium]